MNSSCQINIEATALADPERFQQLTDEDRETYHEPALLVLPIPPKTDDEKCCKKSRNWTEWRGASFPAERHSEYLYLPEDVEGVGPRILISAVVSLPESLESYLANIPSKYRRDISAKRARNHGYSFRPIQPAEHASEIWQIVHSRTERQGKPISTTYYDRSMDATFPEYCEYRDLSYRDICTGVFDVEGVLVAYLLGKRVGAHIQYDEIFGHGNHLKRGVMQLLHYGFLEQCIYIEEPPTCLNYGPWYSGQKPFSKTGGLNQWKRRAGFKPAYLIAASF